jgi:hypothetical protein
MTDPAVLDEPRPLGADDDIHAKPARLETTLGPQLVQPRECRRRHDREWTDIEERTDGDQGRHAERGEQRRSELLRDHRVSVAPRVCALDVGVVHVDGEVIGGNPRQSDIAPKIC